MVDAILETFLDRFLETLREALREPHLNPLHALSGPLQVVMNPLDAPTDSHGRKTDGRLSGLFQVGGGLLVDSQLSFLLLNLPDFDDGDK
jgi:hypothetical protein